MFNQLPMQAVLITPTSISPSAATFELALFKADGTARTIPTAAAAQIDSVATTVAGLVTDFNALLAKRRTAGVLLP